MPSPVREAQSSVKVLGVGNHAVHHFPGGFLIWAGQGKLLHLVELVHPMRTHGWGLLVFVCVCVFLCE
jgi:hypothetical protein